MGLSVDNKFTCKSDFGHEIKWKRSQYIFISPPILLSSTSPLFEKKNLANINIMWTPKSKL